MLRILTSIIVLKFCSSSLLPQPLPELLKALVLKLHEINIRCSAVEFSFYSTPNNLESPENWVGALNEQIPERLSKAIPNLVSDIGSLNDSSIRDGNVIRSVKYQLMCSIAFLPKMDMDANNKDEFVRLRQMYLALGDQFYNRDFTYFIFIMGGMEQALLSSYIATTTPLQYKLFIVDSLAVNGQFKIYTNSLNTGIPFVEIGSYAEPTTLTLRMYQYPFEAPNFQNEELLTLVCPLCADIVELYERTGLWEGYVIAPAYETFIRYNATFKQQALFALPDNNPDENGVWDDYTQPLIDGTAAVSTLIQPSALKSLLILISKPMVFSYASFIVGPPRLASFETFDVLKEPFHGDVWTAYFVSFLIIGLCLRGVIYWSDREQSKIGLLKVFITLIRPMLEQEPLVGSEYKEVRRSGLVNWFVGLWSVNLIVLICAYKSKLFSSIVCPRYVQPPTTFQELADSSIKIGAVFFTGHLEDDLLALNSSAALKIAKRAVEYDYIDPECYYSVIKSDAACFGYSLVFEGIGNEYTTDIHGRNLYRGSKESGFPTSSGNGVSKHYPMLINMINIQVGIGDSSGLSELAVRNHKVSRGRLGVKYAKAMLSINPVYGGAEEANRRAGNQNVTTLLYHTAFYGFGIAALVLFLEGLTRLLYRRRLSSDQALQATLWVQNM